MRNLTIIFALLFLIAQHVTAQDKPRFYAEANPLEVSVGETIKVSFILENGKNNGRFSPPDWEAAGFLLLGSSQASNISIMNGEMKTTASYVYNLSPIEAGTLTIPSAIIKNGEGELHTEPITIQALPNADGVRPPLSKRSPAAPKSEPKRTFKTIKM